MPGLQLRDRRTPESGRVSYLGERSWWPGRTRPGVVSRFVDVVLKEVQCPLRHCDDTLPPGLKDTEIVPNWDAGSTNSVGALLPDESPGVRGVPEHSVPGGTIGAESLFRTRVKSSGPTSSLSPIEWRITVVRSFPPAVPSIRVHENIRRYERLRLSSGSGTPSVEAASALVALDLARRETTATPARGRADRSVGALLPSCFEASSPVDRYGACPEYRRC
jgi:hypothetical protein